MVTSTSILITLIVISSALIIDVILKPSITSHRSGKILAFVALCILPLLVGFLGASEHLERSKKTAFCLSCHVMEDYGKSLYVDDKEYVPANHFQNNRIPRDKACYTCHTDYTMYGDVNAKLRGLRHLYVQYIGTIPDTLKLYSPYNNRECLHCHEGARSFVENPHHSETPTMLASITSNQLSCISSGCHDVIHNVHELNGVEFWKGSAQ